MFFFFFLQLKNAHIQTLERATKTITIISLVELSPSYLLLAACFALPPIVCKNNQIVSSLVEENDDKINQFVCLFVRCFVLSQCLLLSYVLRLRRTANVDSFLRSCLCCCNIATQEKEKTKRDLERREVKKKKERGKCR